MATIVILHIYIIRYKIQPNDYLEYSNTVITFFLSQNSYTASVFVVIISICTSHLAGTITLNLQSSFKAAFQI